MDDLLKNDADPYAVLPDPSFHLYPVVPPELTPTTELHDDWISSDATFSTVDSG
ncbi:hypothetical protein SLEP1_g37136 [Rubroshorea leprosula]|uniref:Uncharacterized protein n=1 Tax=Rubroshorea leprosula TaxID=152421 RepID=A0AAV5KTY5_9ROSI|nr:hypothetical protein SLEP1_g37136 [Rubroshorea leprosula]